MNFDIDNYKQKLKNPAMRSVAQESLEFAIKRAPIEQAIELKKLRTPGVIARLELKRLRAAGFDMDAKNIDGVEYDCLLLACHARWDHAKKHWPHLADYYSMSDHPIHGVAA